MCIRFDDCCEEPPSKRTTNPKCPAGPVPWCNRRDCCGMFCALFAWGVIISTNYVCATFVLSESHELAVRPSARRPPLRPLRPPHPRSPFASTHTPTRTHPIHRSRAAPSSPPRLDATHTQFRGSAPPRSAQQFSLRTKASSPSCVGRTTRRCARTLARFRRMSSRSQSLLSTMQSTWPSRVK